MYTNSSKPSKQRALRERDGFQFVRDVLGNFLCYFRNFDVSFHVALQETRKRRRLLPQSDIEGFRSMGGLRQPEPLCLDPGGYGFLRTRRSWNLWLGHCCLLRLHEHWFVSSSVLFQLFSEFFYFMIFFSNVFSFWIPVCFMNYEMEFWNYSGDELPFFHYYYYLFEVVKMLSLKMKTNRESLILIRPT